MRIAVYLRFSSERLVDSQLERVERGDTTNFHLRLVAPDRIEFVGIEGGEHPVVGRGSLTRE